ncbi:MAG: hypothetical protein OHK0015_28360 [Chloroflexi bacterium OHK40]
MTMTILQQSWGRGALEWGACGVTASEEGSHGQKAVIEVLDAIMNSFERTVPLYRCSTGLSPKFGPN